MDYSKELFRYGFYTKRADQGALFGRWGDRVLNKVSWMVVIGSTLWLVPTVLFA